MTQLWILIALLSALALLFVAVPVLRFRDTDRAADIAIRKAKNIEVFRQRERELDQDLADGLIDAEQHARLKAELERPFLREMQQFEREEAEHARRVARGRHYNKLVPLALALLIPVGGILIYQQRGAGHDLPLPDIMARLGNAQDAETQRATLVELAEFLDARFARRPGDVQNGYMLGTLQLSLGNYEAATRVFEQLLDAVPSGTDRATILGQLAQARYLLADQEITPDVRSVMDQATAINPNENAVMSLLAIDAFLQEDFAGAVQYWRRQLSQLNPGSQDARMLQERIFQVQQLIPQEEQEHVASTGGKRVEVRVEVAEALLGQVSPDMRVFVFASNPAGGPPLAAKNLSAAELPLSVTLGEDDAMLPQFTLANAETIVVSARVSRSGEANAQSGDLQAVSQPFDLAAQDGPVELTISDVVP